MKPSPLPLLGVNIDHVATVRNARGTTYPDPLLAALQAELAGADGITLHLREDRRHIRDKDVYRFKEALQTRMNLEMAITQEMVDIACDVQPEHVCLVPEKREEVTTEGGLNVVGLDAQSKRLITRLNDNAMEVSLFIDADNEQIKAARDTGAPVIELHTGAYADATNPAMREREFEKIALAVDFAASQKLIVNVGHGLHYHNVEPIAALEQVNELNIGHSLIAHALFVGIEQAVKEMKALIRGARL